MVVRPRVGRLRGLGRRRGGLVGAGSDDGLADGSADALGGAGGSELGDGDARSGVGVVGRDVDRRDRPWRAAWPACRGRPPSGRRRRPGAPRRRGGRTAWAGGHVDGPRCGFPCGASVGRRSCPRHRARVTDPVTGRREREDQAAARPRPRAERAAEQRGVLGGDREAQAGAAAAPRRVRLVEAVEQVWERPRAARPGRDPRPRSPRPRAVRVERHLDRRRRRVLAGVVEQVAQDAVQAPGVGVDDTGAAGSVIAAAGSRAATSPVTRRPRSRARAPAARHPRRSARSP